ncbi:MAG: hypothetical protein CVU51_03615 [Deltaproteobacteria bacterium HGW-Deltaproteobacteria-1]|jgi:hypothetical protein|nr:MAG: hypothetical protein CVU51_03615 [Deltaproteobacteria bacterium HGW-Deltaproteobacteria-1]
MIIDIDDQESVQVATEQISKDWFVTADLYADLKTTGKTDSSGFWGITTQMLADVTYCLDCTEDHFLNKWDQSCIANDMRIMGYHCTRHSDQQVFLEKGILPLSEETVRLAADSNPTAQGKSAWVYRSQQSPGPFFFLSYKCAKKPDDHFCDHGPEILLGCAGQ